MTCPSEYPVVESRPLCVLFLFTVHALAKPDIWRLPISNPLSHRHGGIRMGVSDDACDNGKNHLGVDWNIEDLSLHSCMDPYLIDTERVSDSRPYCTTVEEKPLHICMNQTINYGDTIPLSGAHRPLWPVYGEYLYLPPQRWVHSLEHGAVVLLYHPCADREKVMKLKSIVKRCLRRHIITPYNRLPLSQPFTLVTYQCKMTINKINECKIAEFIRDTAIRAPEKHVWENGQYSFGLTDPATVVPGSDEQDTFLCPDICRGVMKH